MENSEREGNTRPPDLPPEKSMQVKKQQLELDMEQQTGSKSGKKYVNAVYCQPAPFLVKLAWRIPGTGEPGGLRSMGSHRVRHD